MWDWGAMKFFLDLLLAVGVVAVGVYTWWVTRGQATKAAIDAVGERVDHVEHRVARVEQDVKHLPTHDDVMDLSAKISNLHGDLRELRGSMKGVERSVQLINEHLINKGS
jgi:outer membrane murein-binding lipoprotein Lpp